MTSDTECTQRWQPKTAFPCVSLLQGFTEPPTGWWTVHMSKGKFDQNLFDFRTVFFFPLTIAWGLVFCTTQSEYFYKSFIFFGQIFNRKLNKTAMAETNGNGFGNEHCQELRWEALERRPRASGVLITDRMDVIRPCNKPATCRSGKRVPMQQSLQQWLLQGDLLKELMHQPRPVINAQNTIMFIPQFWYPNSLEVINWT